MDKSKIDRINELARKKKAIGLTPEELSEQRSLREEYLLAVRKNLTATIENTEFVYPDGTTKTMKKK